MSEEFDINDRNSVVLFLKNSGLVDNYSIKLFSQQYPDIYKRYPNIYDCIEFQEYLAEIYFSLCNIKTDTWRRIYEKDGRRGVTGYCSGLIHRTIKSTASNAYRDIMLHQKRFKAYDGVNLNKIIDKNNG